MIAIVMSWLIKVLGRQTLWKIAAAVGVLVAIVSAFFWTYEHGRQNGIESIRAQWQAEKASQAQAALTVQTKQAQATVKVVTQYVDRVRVVHDQGATIVKEVPVYVTKNADAQCRVSIGFVRVHNAAASGVPIPQPPSAADDSPAGITLSGATRAITGNYQTCRENAEQLTALQNWVFEQTSLGKK